MSRTRKGARPPGYEVDRKREGKRGWRSPGATAKRIAHKAQRKIGKVECSGFRCARGGYCPKCSPEGDRVSRRAYRGE